MKDQKNSRSQPQWDPPLDSFQTIFQEVAQLQQNPEMVNQQSNYLFRQQRTSQHSRQTLLQAAQSGSELPTEQAFPTQTQQASPFPPIPSVGVDLGVGQGIPEAQRLAQFDLNTVEPNQRDLIERSMAIGGVSRANNGYNARTNAQRDHNLAQGQDDFATP